MKIGCHISVAKGFHEAAIRAYELGATSFQVFTKNPRSLRSKQVNEKDAEQGRSFCLQHGLTLITHTPYITNLSTPKDDLHKLTIRSIREDLHISDAYKAVGAVVHCGKHVGEGVEYGLQRMIDTLDLILQDYDGETKLLLENTAGQGTELGQTLSELVQIRNASQYKERIGFCFDTCHAFAAGAWSYDTFQDLVLEMKATRYLDSLVAIHFNDSKVPFNSHKDRHEKIGKGEIGAEALALFLNEEVFTGLPVVLETPVEVESEYGDEIKFLLTLKN